VGEGARIAAKGSFMAFGEPSSEINAEYDHNKDIGLESLVGYVE
jgi:hypothetical protein